MLTTALLMTSCSDDPEPSGAGGASGDTPGADGGLTEVQDRFGVPEECRTAFPSALAAASLDDLDVVPTNWPEPPVPATLCQASGSLDGTIATIDYVTDVSPEEVLAAYEAALVPFEVGADRSAGLTGQAGSTAFSVTAPAGTIRVSFRAE